MAGIDTSPRTFMIEEIFHHCNISFNSIDKTETFKTPLASINFT